MPTVAELTAEVAELRAAVFNLTSRLDNVRVIKHRSQVPMDAPCNIGNDPQKCGPASVYHYQHGCRGESCLDQNAAYYAENRDAKAGLGHTNGTSATVNKRSRTGVVKDAPVTVKSKKVAPSGAKKAPAPKAAPPAARKRAGTKQAAKA